MPTMKGPCVDCGTVVEKYVRPGRQLRCLDCGIIRVEDHARTMHDGSSPMYDKAVASGRLIGEQIARGEGEYYERWVQGMQAYLRAASTMKPFKAATVSADKPTQRATRTKEKKPDGRNQR